MKPTHDSTRILLAVRNWFIFLSFGIALLLDLMPAPPGWPDWVALVLTFWCVREPLKVGMATGFALGIAVDVADAAVMGEHALGYVLLAYAAGALSRRILWFPLSLQALHVLPLLLAMQVVTLAARMLGGAAFPGWTPFLASLSGAALWIPLNYLLLAPQYRPVEKDENRPI
ncbi:MAG TPA: rod shape-determining protein MreD [Rhodocyclaceae bacterium]|nr:MAG: rod shape-determining protein MreD [Betaproteobacteria bacterium CG2_30_68_42]PIX75854.1 MAG: rod shape-determining protein MreD [Rhodocyclales bacterium CG_4_10_14_3_um_filter_68_10]PJA56175.1 MAG: rod shape-determining protein MreD [Rhodocyclales bacterium CG_4_9_14_3_um_filter_68_10]HCX33162.1 rod shape-determining protein MreD [Rhodocyclaceae bacterium]